MPSSYGYFAVPFCHYDAALFLFIIRKFYSPMSHWLSLRRVLFFQLPCTIPI
ncbi:hypothetical protein T11_5644 [Trichinella zimbabwensis]|uniref:Uncharacterized protein n=1 Tax=Trichinella zimbabwensis TaxID=268475 RepID=A0A0V1GCE9_9BILA|nr:hypothetical protein T11_5644 [Trichinella zimbabwensis]